MSHNLRVKNHVPLCFKVLAISLLQFVTPIHNSTQPMHYRRTALVAAYSMVLMYRRFLGECLRRSSQKDCMCQLGSNASSYNNLSYRRMEITENFTLRSTPKLPPAQNLLVHSKLLDEVQCAYLQDYNVIVCMDLQDGKYCGYALPLDHMAHHCYTASSLGRNTPRKPHSVSLFKHSQAGRKLPPKIIQFYRDVLDKYPNVIVSIAELRALRPRPDQRGPIKHIRPPVDGMVCTLCDFALPSNVGRKTWRQHWAKHEISGKKKKTLPYLKANIQSFHYDTNHRLSFAVPPLDASSTITKPHAAGVSTLLASQLRKLMGVNYQTGRAMERKAILPFFQHIGAADYIQGYEAQVLTELIALPQAREISLMKLKKTMLHRFSELCGKVASSNHIVRRLLVATRKCVCCIYLQLHNSNIFKVERLAFQSDFLLQSLPKPAFHMGWRRFGLSV